MTLLIPLPIRTLVTSMFVQGPPVNTARQTETCHGAAVRGAAPYLSMYVASFARYRRKCAGNAAPSKRPTLPIHHPASPFHQATAENSVSIEQRILPHLRPVYRKGMCRLRS